MLACSRLALGDAGVAARLARDEGRELRGRAEELVRCALTGDTSARPWLGLLDAAKAAGAAAGEQLRERLQGELELLPSKERKRHEREGAEAQRRGERRTRTRTLDLGLRLAELWLRDLLCVREGAPELDLRRRPAGAARAGCRRAGAGVDALRRGVELVADTRLSLSLNVSEELALEALAYRLQALFAGDALAGQLGSFRER